MSINFGIKIKELRTFRKISQNELSKTLNISQSILSDWENGKSEPTETNISKIAEYFNVSTDYLLGLENEDYTKTYDYSIEKIKSDLASDNNTSAKLDMKNKIENIAKDKKIPLEKLSNLSEEQINLIIQLAKTFNKN